MRRIPFGLSVVAIITIFGLGSGVGASAEAADDPSAPAVVMISLDGTRPADLEAGRLPSLSKLAARGASAERMIPSFPTNTFPNHVTLVTGVAPERHGIVDNTFVDPERGLFEKKDIPSWILVEPIWSIVSRAGMFSASFHWVGSEGDWPGGEGPTHWKPFSSETREDEKVEQILRWLEPIVGERPCLITSWFHGADHASHHQGPDSDEVVRSLAQQDRALQALIDHFDAQGLWATTALVVVSDHGMMVPETRIDLGGALTAAGLDARVIGIGGFVSIRVGEAEADRAVEVARSVGLSAWKRADAPPELRVRHPRFGTVVAVAPPTAAVVYDGLVLTGFHGHPPDVPEMSAILVAAGRGIRRGATVSTVRNVDVAPTVLRLLGVDPPEWMEGRPIAGLLDLEGV
jgi:hypothetical protein